MSICSACKSAPQVTEKETEQEEEEEEESGTYRGGHSLRDGVRSNLPRPVDYRGLPKASLPYLGFPYALPPTGSGGQ